MDRSRIRRFKQSVRREPGGKYASYAPRLIGYVILAAALLFIVIGLAIS